MLDWTVTCERGQGREGAEVIKVTSLGRGGTQPGFEEWTGKRESGIHECTWGRERLFLQRAWLSIGRTRTHKLQPRKINVKSSTELRQFCEEEKKFLASWILVRVHLFYHLWQGCSSLGPGILYLERLHKVRISRGGFYSPKATALKVGGLWLSWKTGITLCKKG